ncbi:hypothetical protein [Pseudomonas fluorescens]
MSVNDSESTDVVISGMSNKDSIPKKTDRPVIYIGTDLYNVATQHAIAVSYMTGTQVTPAKFTQYLIKEFGAKAVESLSASIKTPQHD